MGDRIGPEYAILTFGTYWAVKTRELKLSSLEKDPDEAVTFAVEREKIK